MAAAQQLEARGVSVERVPVDSSGQLEFEAFERARALDPDDPLYESAVASLRAMLRERDR